MAISKGLLLKVIGGLAGTVGVAGGGIVLGNHDWKGQDTETTPDTREGSEQPGAVGGATDSTQEQTNHSNTISQNTEGDNSRSGSQTENGSDRGGNSSGDQQGREGGVPSGDGQDNTGEKNAGTPSKIATETEDDNVVQKQVQSISGDSGQKSSSSPKTDSTNEKATNTGGANGLREEDPGTTHEPSEGELGKQNEASRVSQTENGNSEKVTDPSQASPKSSSIEVGESQPQQNVNNNSVSEPNALDNGINPSGGTDGDKGGAGGGVSDTPEGKTTESAEEEQKINSETGGGTSTIQTDNAPVADLSVQTATGGQTGGGGGSPATPEPGTTQITGKENQVSEQGEESQSETVTTKDRTGSQHLNSSDLSDQVPGSSGSQSREDGVNNPAGQPGEGASATDSQQPESAGLNGSTHSKERGDQMNTTPGETSEVTDKVSTSEGGAGTTTGQEPTQHTPVVESSTVRNSNPDDGQQKPQVSDTDPNGDGSQQQVQQQQPQTENPQKTNSQSSDTAEPNVTNEGSNDAPDGSPGTKQATEIPISTDLKNPGSPSLDGTENQPTTNDSGSQITGGAGGTPQVQSPDSGSDLSNHSNLREHLEGAGEPIAADPTSSQNTESQSNSQTDKENEKLKTLGIPNSCKFETGKTIIEECSISKEELKQMKFENSDGNEVTVGEDEDVKNLKLKIEILSENKKEDYKNGEGEENYNLLFTFSGFEKKINLDSDDALIIYPNTNPEFVKGEKGLKRLWDPSTTLTKKVGIRISSGSGSFENNTTPLKYSLDSGENIKTLNSPTTSGTIDVEGDKDNYNQDLRVNFREKISGTDDNSETVTLEKGDYEVKYDTTNGWYLSKKTT